MVEQGESNWKMINGIIEGEEPLDVKGKFSGDRAMRIIGGIVSNSRHTELQANLPNQGQIPNLLDGAIVETPAFVDSSGISPIDVGELPEGLAALCNIQTLVTDLVVEAAVHGDKDLALQAILADPVVHDLEAGKKAFKALMEAHADLLPQFTDAA
jgi:alpha-galactosidase